MKAPIFRLNHFLVCSALILGSSPTCFADGGGSEGGGSATIRQERFVFFDLRNQIEAVKEANQIKAVETDPAMQELTYGETSVDDSAGARKLKEMANASIETCEVVKASSQEAVWVKTNAQLKPLHDVAMKANEQQDPSGVIQVAIHDQGMVTINGKLFSLLSPTNQAAAIVHETLRAMAYQRNFPLSTADVQLLTEALVSGKPIDSRFSPLFSSMRLLTSMSEREAQAHVDSMVKLLALSEATKSSDYKRLMSLALKIQENPRAATYRDYASLFSGISSDIDATLEYRFLAENKLSSRDEIPAAWNKAHPEMSYDQARTLVAELRQVAAPYKILSAAKEIGGETYRNAQEKFTQGSDDKGAKEIATDLMTKLSDKINELSVSGPSENSEQILVLGKDFRAVDMVRAGLSDSELEYARNQLKTITINNLISVVKNAGYSIQVTTPKVVR